MAGDPLLKKTDGEGRPGFVSFHRALFFLLVAYVLLWSPLPAPGQETLSVSGITESIDDVTLSLSVAGTVSKVFFEEGDKVRSGQSILHLDRRLEQLEVARRKLIWESKAEVESAQARVLTLKSQLESTRDLFQSTGSVSREELEEKELEYKLALAEQKRLAMEEEKQRIEYEMAVENLSKRRLTSPIGGVVIKLFLDVGESCEPEQPLAHVVDPSRCLFICNMEEWLGRTLKPGQVVDLAINTGYETVAKKGKIVFASPVVDPASGLLEVKAAFENQDGEVRPGVSGSMLLKAP
jgi:RND family efflux transporter MFP subunit